MEESPSVDWTIATIGRPIQGHHESWATKFVRTSNGLKDYKHWDPQERNWDWHMRLNMKQERWNK